MSAGRVGARERDVSRFFWGLTSIAVSSLYLILFMAKLGWSKRYYGYNTMQCIHVNAYLHRHTHIHTNTRKHTHVYVHIIHVNTYIYIHTAIAISSPVA